MSVLEFIFEMIGGFFQHFGKMFSDQMSGKARAFLVCLLVVFAVCGCVLLARALLFSK